MTQAVPPIDDSDMVNATAALIRAAKRARKLAEETGTELVVRRNGKLVRDSATFYRDRK